MIVLLVSLLTAPALSADPPSAKELLEKYGANLDKQTSFIVKYETSGFGSRNLGGNSARESFCEGEACYDGCRTAYRDYAWGQIGNDWIEPSHRVYYSRMWDGTAYYHYSRSASDEGMLTRERTRNLDEIVKRLGSGGKATDIKPLPSSGHNCYFRPSAMPVSRAFGYFHDDMERLDVALLEQSKSLSVRPKMAKANGADCYVIDADTRRGKYTVWIDPKHGYQTARVAVARRAGDEALHISGYQLEAGSIDATVDYVRFQNVDGVWVAVETKHQYKRVFGTADPTHRFYRFQNRVRITSVQLNPDHEALRSFAPHDVRDGAMVVDTEWSNEGREGAGYLVWRNGKEVPDREAVKRYSEKYMQKAAKRPSAGATRPSTRAAPTGTRPAKGEAAPGQVSGNRQAMYKKGSSSHPSKAHGGD